MKPTLLVALVVAFSASGCAKNRPEDEPGARIHDTTMTSRDTTNPNDTLPHIQDSVPDSTSK